MNFNNYGQGGISLNSDINEVTVVMILLFDSMYVAHVIIHNFSFQRVKWLVTVIRDIQCANCLESN